MFFQEDIEISRKDVKIDLFIELTSRYIHNIELGQVKLDQPTVKRTSELE